MQTIMVCIIASWTTYNVRVRVKPDQRRECWTEIKMRVNPPPFDEIALE